MRNSVIIKHERYGLRILLDASPEWEELLADVREKFTSSAAFFGDAALTLTFAGRKLTETEEDEVVRIIAESTQIRVLCVFVEDPERQSLFVRAANLYTENDAAFRASAAAAEESLQALLREEQEEEDSSSQGGGRYQMLLRSLHNGEIYRTERTIIVLGNVEEGAALTTGRDAIVLGSVRGVIRAGEEKEGRHFVASSDLRPKKLSIDGVTLRTKGRIFSRISPAVAAVQNGEIRIVPFDGNLEELFH